MALPDRHSTRRPSVAARVAINDRGRTAGAYLCDEADPGPFVRSWNGRYTSFEVPPDPSALVFDINDRGDIVISGPGGLLKGRAVPVGGA
jgi:hypothetical protein